MNNPKDKGKNRQGSSGRPGTKFMERPGVESDAGKDEGQISPTGEDLKGENWKVAGPKPKGPNQKTDKDKESGGDPQSWGKD